MKDCHISNNQQCTLDDIIYIIVHSALTVYSIVLVYLYSIV